MARAAWDSNSVEAQTSNTCCIHCLKQYEWWDPPEENPVFDYCRHSGLHGLKYIGQPERHLSERVFWMLAFSLGIIGAFVLIRDVFYKYRANPVIVSFQPYETQIETIPFPAITICNMNKVLRSKALKYIEEENSGQNSRMKSASHSNSHYLEHVCYAEKSFGTRFNISSNVTTMNDSANFDKSAELKEYTDVEQCLDCEDESGSVVPGVKEFLKQASQPCEDMLKFCIWEEEPVECQRIFHPLETDYGKCCVFNLLPPTLLDTLQNDSRDDPEEVHEWAKWNIHKKGIFLDSQYDHEYPRRQRRAGKTYGLSVLLNPNLDEYFCTSSDSKGFRMVANLPTEFPQVMDFGVALGPQMEMFVGIRPDIVMSEQAVVKSPLEKRECYFPGEFPLQYYNYYTSSNCLNECIANETFLQCKCVTYFMPRDGIRKLCDAKDFPCVSKARRNFTRNGKRATCSHCLPACTELRYFMEVTETPLLTQYQGSMGDRTNFTSWAELNASIVHIYFAQESTYARIRKELYGITDLIASTGGLMGLCLGFSGLSLVEVIYFFTLRAWCRAFHQRGRHRDRFSTLSQITNDVKVWMEFKTAKPKPADAAISHAKNGPMYAWELSPKFLSTVHSEDESRSKKILGKLPYKTASEGLPGDDVWI